VSYLVDTNVLSEWRKGPRADAGVVRWFGEVADDEIYVSVLTVGELRRGVDSIERRDAAAARVLNRWLRGLVEGFSERLLPVDKAVAEEWGRMNAARSLPVIDSLLAATAKVHGLTLVTRNTKDIASTGIHCLNPFRDR
jgi:predicted nucleic acid-binding protein